MKCCSKNSLTPNEDDDLIAKAKKVGSKFFAAGAGAGNSGFLFPKNPRIIRMSLADFKEQATLEDEGPLYGTMQSVFKPSEMKIVDKSDSPITAADFDKDGVLYVIDSEEGVYVITKEKPTVKSSEKESTKSTGNDPTWVVTDSGGYTYTLKPEKYPGMSTDPKEVLAFARDSNVRHGPRIYNAVSVERKS